MKLWIRSGRFQEYLVCPIKDLFGFRRRTCCTFPSIVRWSSKNPTWPRRLRLREPPLPCLSRTRLGTAAQVQAISTISWTWKNDCCSICASRKHIYDRGCPKSRSQSRSGLFAAVNGGWPRLIAPCWESRAYNVSSNSTRLLYIITRTT